MPMAAAPNRPSAPGAGTGVPPDEPPDEPPLVLVVEPPEVDEPPLVLVVEPPEVDEPPLDELLLELVLVLDELLWPQPL